METPCATPVGPVLRKSAPRKTVAVFGASWAKPGSELYDESVKLGSGIAAAGFALVTGGYSGTMEGTSKGAAEIPGSSRVGVIVPSLFPSRYSGGNEYLTETIATDTLLDRIHVMVKAADIFVGVKGDENRATR